MLACAAGAAPKTFEAASVEAGPRWREHQCLSLERSSSWWLVGGRGRVPAGATMARKGAAVVFLENAHGNNKTIHDN